MRFKGKLLNKQITKTKMDRVNLRVLIKEPRGFIRILQILFSILAWLTTSGFKAKSTLHIDCPNEVFDDPFKVEYKISYPFDLRQTELSVPADCRDDTELVPKTFPIDFSATAMLYVLVCIISLLYATCILVCYCFLTARYESDPLAPMADLCATILIALFWIIITLIWALNVTDLKYYTHPHYFKDYLEVCQDQETNCQPSNPGKWSSLTVSIICGFTCIVLWLGSTWFIFKETTLHKQKQQQQQQAQQQSAETMYMQPGMNQQMGSGI